MVTANKFTASGLWLFIDQMLIAIGGWAFWLVVFRFTTSSEIGQATTIYSLVFLLTTLMQLGLEYPLLRKAPGIGSSQVFGTILVIELLILAVSVPVIIYATNNLFQESFGEYTWIAVGMLIASTIGFVSRFALLAMSDIKSVMIIDASGTITKFLLGYFLVTMGFAGLGILLAFFIQGVVMMGASLTVAAKRLGLQLGSLKYTREIITDGLVNSLSKFSRMLVVSFAVVLLASFGIDDSDIGVFYVAAMISIVASTLASSIAYMVIPASTASRTDLSHDSLRLSLSLISPLIASLIVAPQFILSLLGDHYVAAESLLLILGIGILPSSITINTISKFNNLNMRRKLVSLGSIQLLALIVTFYFLVPGYGTLGAALSMFIAFVISAIISTIWLDRISAGFIARSSVAITAGVAAGYIITIVIGPIIPPPLVILIAVIVDILCILALKNTSTHELRELLQTLANRR